MGTRVETKHVGLEVGKIVAKYLYGTEDLHYGYWPPDLAPCLQNFPAAQSRHSEAILERIPRDVHSILDVGSGAGVLAQRLQAQGHDVECVVPSRMLAEECRAKLGPSARVHECTLEELAPERAYDLVLFSESFQYIPVSVSLAKCEELVRPGGHVLICDCFKKDLPGRGPISGGTRWRKLVAELERRPFRVVDDLDMTDGVAPSFDVFADLLQNLARPIGDALSGYARSAHPLATRVLSWTFRERLRKVERRYFSGAITADAFRHWNSYRLLVLQRA